MFSMLPFAYAVALSAITIIILSNIWRYFQGGQFQKTNVRLDGKVVIITGCNTGIGKETAMDLARRGARVYMGCRNDSKGQIARQEIIQMTKNRCVYYLNIDLASLQSIRDFVKRFLKLENRLDILINNAGVLAYPHKFTVDGFETTIGVNHLGPFLLTNLLLNTLKNSSPSRIVNVSGQIYRFVSINKASMHFTLNSSKITAYMQSKLANVLFTRALAKRLRGTGITVNCSHPGIVDTDIYRYQNLLVKFCLHIVHYILKTPRSGAQTTISCAIDPTLRDVSGKSFTDCNISLESSKARDDDTAEWLWQTSVKLTDFMSS